MVVEPLEVDHLLDRLTYAEEAELEVAACQVLSTKVSGGLLGRGRPVSEVILVQDPLVGHPAGIQPYLLPQGGVGHPREILQGGHLIFVVSGRSKTPLVRNCSQSKLG